jgi:hypothetical protein
MYRWLHSSTHPSHTTFQLLPPHWQLHRYLFCHLAAIQFTHLSLPTDQAGFDQPPSDLDDDEDDYDLEDVSSDVEIDPAELDIPGDDEDEGDSR